MKEVVLFFSFFLLTFTDCKQCQIWNEEEEKEISGFNQLQNFENAIKEEKQNTVLKIQQGYSQINSQIETFEKIKKDIWGESTEGGEAEYFIQNGEIQKIIATYLGETGRWQYELFYKKSKVFFVREKIYSYNRPIYWDEELAKEFGDSEIFDDNKTIVSWNEYFFEDEKLIFWINDKQEETQENTQSFKEKEKSILGKNKGLLEKYP
jgi:hypothetical protein